MDKNRLNTNLESIRYLLSHLHSEVTALESMYSQVLLVLRKLEKAADVDELTGLMRRRSFFTKWNELLGECQKLNEECGMIILDIDHFKAVNDTYGHSTGDDVIRAVADLLKQFESPNCVVGRLGGEEFVVATRGSEEQVIGLAEMIRTGAEKLQGEIAAPNPHAGQKWKCTLSAGVASIRSVGFDATRLLESADEALYMAKHAGRNQVKKAA